ncbi:MAG: class I SAM-dependent methyltransferase [Myxococcota bacterium]
MAIFNRDSDRQWERYGSQDPYYGVLSDEKFRGAPQGASREEFFQSGVDQIDFVLSVARERLDADFAPVSALDFGAGVGRCTVALARRCERVTGVDVSASMLEEARRNCVAFGVDNVTLVQGDDALSHVEGPFDLLHCVLVFQHIRRSRGEALFASLVDLLSEGGIGAVQFVYQRTDARWIRLLGWLRREVPLFHNLVNLAYGRPFSDPLMEKNVYDLNRLFALLQERGCGEVHTRFMGEGKLRSVVLFFRKAVRPLPVSHYE